MEKNISHPGALRTVSGNNNRQFLTFVLNTDIYGIDILSIKEIIDYSNITRVPMVPSFIAGMVNLRGNVVPVIDLAKRFSMQISERTKRSSIIIIDLNLSEDSMSIGIIVDEVSEVIDVPYLDIIPAPEFGTKIRTDFISGMGKFDQRLFILLNIENVLSINELSSF
ncbi:MAG: purine-binding chemotaxis protein CheW [Paraglaciecola sp.]|jgi:purine-binding chemotaxis protein CheW